MLFGSSALKELLLTDTYAYATLPSSVADSALLPLPLGDQFLELDFDFSIDALCLADLNYIQLLRLIWLGGFGICDVLYLSGCLCVSRTPSFSTLTLRATAASGPFWPTPLTLRGSAARLPLRLPLP